ncbi:hypothetical protein B0H11DRAFT_1932112 [Mycena galericulata]|nr:hypothetical protein B0H11DRAFT_1932112 [Mycena galericulata]
MPPKQVFCSCCNQMVSEKMERKHRRDSNAAPYGPPASTYPSRQRRIFAPSSEADPEDLEHGNAVAGPSNYHRSETPDPLADIYGVASPEPTAMEVDEEEPDVDNLFVDENIDLSFTNNYAHPVAGLSSESDDDTESEHDIDDEEEMREEDSDGEDPDQDPFDWDSFTAPDDGLSAWDKLGEGYEAEAATGVCSPLFQPVN